MKEEFRDIPIYKDHFISTTNFNTGITGGVIGLQPLNFKDAITVCLPIKLKKTHPDAKVPRYAKLGDAGMDLFAINIEETSDYIEYDTGIAIEIPSGYVGFIFPRSSNSKKDLILANSAGMIDSGYRGSLKLRFKRVSNGLKRLLHHKKYSIGDAVGQLIILPYPQIKFNLVDELSDSERGESGFGSTGA
jgi:dUTP pyrophosphatase